MELFNNELESIVKKNQRVLAKDYTQILNVIVHVRSYFKGIIIF